MKHLCFALLCAVALVCGPVSSMAEPTPTPSPTPVPTLTPEAPQETGYWLSATGKRHNSKCRFYQKTRGIPCKATDGTACKSCGG